MLFALLFGAIAAPMLVATLTDPTFGSFLISSLFVGAAVLAALQPLHALRGRVDIAVTRDAVVIDQRGAIRSSQQTLSRTSNVRPRVSERSLGDEQTEAVVELEARGRKPIVLGRRFHYDPHTMTWVARWIERASRDVRPRPEDD